MFDVSGWTYLGGWISAGNWADELVPVIGQVN